MSAVTLVEAAILIMVMLPLAAMPSSSVALVVVRSASAGRAHGAAVALGIVVGDLVFVALALTGMTLLAETMGGLFAIVRYAAAAYLIWLGWRLLSSRTPKVHSAPNAARAGIGVDFGAGLLLTLGDVKAILFYASLFPAVVDLTRIDAGGILTIVLITALTVGGVKFAYVILAGSIGSKFSGRMTSAMPRRVAGSVMIGCGAALIVKA